VQIAALLDSPPDSHSPLDGTTLFHQTVSRLVVMGGWYPASSHGRPSFNFFGSGAPELAARVVNNWPRCGSGHEKQGAAAAQLVFLGDEVGEAVRTGAKLMREGPEDDPVRAAYVAYLGGCSCTRGGDGTGGGGRESWDPLTVLYAITSEDSGDPTADGYQEPFLFEKGAAHGYNVIDARDGSNAWVSDDAVTNQAFVRMRVDNVTVAAVLDRRMLAGAWSVSAVAAQAENRGGGRDEL
jgi:hypothetical protein